MKAILNNKTLIGLEKVDEIEIKEDPFTKEIPKIVMQITFTGEGENRKQLQKIFVLTESFPLSYIMESPYIYIKD